MSTAVSELQSSQEISQGIRDLSIPAGSIVNIVGGNQHNSTTQVFLSTALTPATGAPQDTNQTKRRRWKFWVILMLCVFGVCTIIIPSVAITLSKHPKNTPNPVPSAAPTVTISSQNPLGVPDNYTVPSNVSVSGGIEHCAGGSLHGARCLFEPDDNQLKSGEFLAAILGASVNNCVSGDNTTIETQLGGSAFITQQWSGSRLEEGLVSFLNVLPQYYDWSMENTYRVEYHETTAIEPGSQVALVIHVLNNVTTGRMLMKFYREIDNSSFWYVNNVILYRPTHNMTHDFTVLPCNSTFDLPTASPTIPIPANPTLSQPITSSVANSHRLPSWIVPVAVIVALVLLVTIGSCLRYWCRTRTSAG